MGTRFSDPSAATGTQWADYLGGLLIFEVGSVETLQTMYGPSDAVRCIMHVLDGKCAGTIAADTLVFPRVLQSQLRGDVGGLVLGRLEQGVAKPGQNPPWKLAEATPKDRRAADAYWAKHGDDRGERDADEIPF